MKQIAFLFLFIGAVATTFAQNGTERIQLTDMLKIKTAGNITVSNDGSKAAFTVTAIEPDEKSKLDYKYVTQIYVTNMNGDAAPQQMTYAKESSAAAAWSPDGRNIAFV